MGFERTLLVLGIISIKMLFKKIILILIFFLTANLVKAKDTLCPRKNDQKCANYLRNYPLFDTEYKIAANYVPVLPLRALAHAEVYREKKSFHLERYYYVKNLEGDLGKSYQSIILDAEISGFGIFSRKIKAKGKLNEFDLEYENNMSFSLPKKATMKVEAILDNVKFLDLKIKSDGDDMTNKVTGSFFGKEVDYHTEWRDTDGKLSGLEYTIHAEGVQKEENSFKAISNGKISNYNISGSAKMISENEYQSSEDYGPITVKTFITIKE